MEIRPYLITDAIFFGFRQFKRNFFLLAGVSLVSIANMTISRLIIQFIEKQYGLSFEQHIVITLTYIVYIVIELMIAMGWTRISLDIYEKGTSSIDRIFTTTPLMLTYIVVSLIYGSVTFIGLILLIVPGIYLGIMYAFAHIFVIDTGCGPLEALRKSAALTYGYKWYLLWTAIIFMSISFLSIITIIGPYILTYVWLLSQIYIYRKLQEAQIRENPIPIDMP